MSSVALDADALRWVPIGLLWFVDYILVWLVFN